VTTVQRERRTRRWRTRHLVSALVTLAVVCGIAYAVVLVHTYRSSKPAVDAANTFLNSLETNNVDDAYQQLCDATRKQYTEDRFAAYVKAQPGIAGHSSTAVDMSTVNGVANAVVTEDIRTDGGTSIVRSIVVTQSGNNWYVCGQPY